MDTCYWTLCMAIVLASFTRRSTSIGPVIRCDPCDAGTRLLCKPLPKDCVEIVREPGCGCCMTCALSSGQPCGVYTGRCGAGLSCQHQPGETKPLQALLEGRGVCANSSSKRSVGTFYPVNEIPDNAVGREEERNATSPALPAPSGTRRPVGPPRISSHPFFLHPAKAEVLRREQSKRAQSFKMEELPGVSTDQQNFSLETKQEPEYGPCRREMESILNGLKLTDILNPRGFRIPNCDKKGFYKKKQCRPSKGRKRGFCWCVDKYGQPLPGFDGKERGDAQCYNSESQ